MTLASVHLAMLPVTLRARRATCDVFLGPLQFAAIDGGHAIALPGHAWRSLRVVDAWGDDVTDYLGDAAELEIRAELERLET